MTPRSRSSGALSIWSYALNVTFGFPAASTFVIAAVSDVFPWSTCPIVPTFTCGFDRSNFSLAMLTPRCLLLPFHLSRAARGGAHDQNRTDDLVLTKDALCRLSYVGGANNHDCV